ARVWRGFQDIFGTVGNVGRPLGRLVVGYVYKVQEIARTVPPLRLIAVLVSLQEVAMLRRRVTAEVGKIALFALVTTQVDRVVRCREPTDLSEIESLLE